MICDVSSRPVFNLTCNEIGPQTSCNAANVLLSSRFALILNVVPLLE